MIDKNNPDYITPVQEYLLCNVAWWYFPPEEKAIPYIAAAYRI